jgi:hypothetical protein
MSTITAENILKLIEQLPSTERARLREMLAQESAIPVQAKAPRDKCVPCEPMPDRTREWEWIAQHKQEYAGQWVALEGDHLVAASPTRGELSTAIKAAGATLPLIHRIAAPDELPYIGI